MSYQVIGHSDRLIYFTKDNKRFYIKSTLPKQDLILKLNIPPKDVNKEREQIYIAAQTKKLTHKEQIAFMEYKDFNSKEEYAHWLNQT